MEYHKLLTRQLKRLQLKDSIPTQKEWEEFKNVISKTYVEADQERYLLERSMELSSEEMLDINEKLQSAQKMAGLGYWIYDKESNIITLSHNLYQIVGLSTLEHTPTFDAFTGAIHPDNQASLKTFVEKAFSQGEPFEYEFRMKNDGGGYKWYFIIGRPMTAESPITTLTGIVMDIQKRKTAEEEIAELHNQLLDSARYAGMADIASSTLHNVGNVLNSANVSIELLKEQNFLSVKKEIEGITNLLQQHLPCLPEFIQTDPKGKFVPEYLIAMFTNIQNNYETLHKEIENISNHLSHIKDIIATQNDISRASGLSEKVFLPQIMDAALDMASTAFDQSQIQILKNYEEIPFVLVDKVKIIQILVNLLRNAKEAVMEDTENTDKMITCSLSKKNSEKIIIIKIEDNGIGILPKNLNKIFSLGFTTKPHGHGFGLHMSAITAKEMGGNLSVESKRGGKGTTFTLTFPKIDAQSSLEP